MKVSIVLAAIVMAIEAAQYYYKYYMIS